MRKIICSVLVFIIITISLDLNVYAENGNTEDNNDKTKSDINTTLYDLQGEAIQIQEEINEANNKLENVQSELTENLQKIQELDEKISKSELELKEIDDKVSNLNNEIDKNETNLEQVETKYKELKDICEERLIAIYEMPKLQYLDVLLNSKSMSKFISNYYAVKELIHYDTELLKTVESQLKEIEQTKEKLSRQKQQIVEEKQTSQRKAQVLANMKTVRNKYLDDLSKEELELQANIDEYYAKYNEIEDEIKVLALNSISAEYLGGAMTWPVPGYYTITSTYGMRTHPITGVYKLHTGIDIGAPMGSSFRAAANGIVIKAGYNTAYGNMVIIDHGGGVQTLYAHGESISVELGQVVGNGDEVIKVGSTGYSTGPHAHFEVRVNGTTINPLDYLIKKQSEENKKEETKE